MSDYINTKLDAAQVLKRAYDEAENRLRVDAEVTATIGSVDVVIDAASGDNIAIADATGTNTLVVNPDGSINSNITDITLDQANDSVAIGDGVNLVEVTPSGALKVVIDSTGLTTSNVFDEVDNVVSGVTTTILSYAATATTKLISADVGGSNIGMYSIYIGGNLAARKYTYFTNLNERFEFADGLPINNGDLIEIEVVHMRPDLGNFNANILVLN